MNYSDYRYKIPEGKMIRLIVDTDAHNEGDDQYAIAHALLSPRFDVRGIVAAHYGERKSDHSMEESYEEVLRVLDSMDFPRELAYRGTPHAIGRGDPAQVAPGVQLIIDEAMKETDVPLYVVNLGPLTDVARAFQLRPEIRDRLTVVWIGGGEYPKGGAEYNLWNDIPAAQLVFESDLTVWQVPRNAYGEVVVSLAELEDKVYPCGRMGRYLFNELHEYGHTSWALQTNRNGEFWRLGDSPAVGVLLFPHDGMWEMRPAPSFCDDMTYRENPNPHEIRVYSHVDTRVTMEDMFAKFRLFAKRRGEYQP